MKVKRIKGNERARDILAAIVVSTPVVARVASKWVKDGLFKDKWSNIVGKLAVDYYNEYGKAPGKNIKNLVNEWTGRAKDNATIDLVESFLESVSDEYAKRRKEINPDYTIRKAEELFTKVKLEQLRDSIDDGVESDPSKALELVRSFDDVKLGPNAGIDVLRDRNALRAAFEQRKEPLFTLKGALGRFFGETLARGAFISLAGPEKRGKTTWQTEICWQAMRKGKRVGLFGVGDETEEDMLMRFAVRAAMRPQLKTQKDELVAYPTFMEPMVGKDEGIPDIQYKKKKFKENLNYFMAKRAMKKVLGRLGTKESLLTLYTYPNDSVSIMDVMAVLKDQDRHGKPFDMIDIDYADILASPDPNIMADSRDAINKTWKTMRRIAAQYSVLMLTATQTKATSYEAGIIDMTHYAEDKRKWAHVTGAVGLNQTKDEEEVGVFRLNWIVRRKGRWNKKKLCYCAACMDIGNPCIISTF